MKLSELARLTGARVEEKFSDLEITGAAGLDEAEPGHVAFLANPRYTPQRHASRACSCRAVGRASVLRLSAAARHWRLRTQLHAGGVTCQRANTSAT